MFDVVLYSILKKYARNYTDQEIAKIAKGMHYRGVVSVKEDLPLTGNEIGDVYTVTSEAGAEYIWTIDAPSGTMDNWSKLGGTDLSNYYTKPEVDTLLDDLKEDIFSTLNIKNGTGVDSLLNADNVVSGEASVGFGHSNIVSGDHAFSFGQNNISLGFNSITINEENQAKHRSSFVGGYGNLSSANYQALLGIGTNPTEDTLFAIGCGTLDNYENPTTILTRQNAFEVFKDGSVRVYKEPEEDDDVVRKFDLDKKSTVTVSEEGTSEDEVAYITIGDLEYKFKESRMNRDFITGTTVGFLPGGSEITADMKVADVLYSILYGDSFDLYIGYFPYPCTAAQFAAKTATELQEHVLFEKQASDTPYDFVTTWATSEMSVCYIMVKDGRNPKEAEMISGGIITHFTEADIKDPTTWKAVHSDVIINGALYHVYGYRTYWNNDDSFSITVK